MTATPTVRSKPTPLQRGWMIVYWLSLPVTAVLLVQALTSFSVLGFVPLVALILAVSAQATGIVFAHRLLAARPDDVLFLKGTTTLRVIAIAWLLIQLAIYSAVIVSVVANVQDVTVLDWSGGFASTVGSISILAIVGPGYAEYRETLKAAKAAREHAA